MKVCVSATTPLLIGAAILLGCGNPSTAPPVASEPVFSTEPSPRPIMWSGHEVLGCPIARGQLQSIFPLDEDGDVLLLGLAGCPEIAFQDFRVVDVSSGSAVIVDAIDTQQPGFNVNVHSPRGSQIGFGVEGRVLVKYDDGFELLPIPCTVNCTPMNGVWAGSPDAVWVISLDGEILRYDGSDFFLEHFVGSRGLWSLWGFGEQTPSVMYAVGDGILRRDENGTWTDVVSSADARACDDGDGLFRVVGRNPNDIWVASLFDCVMHFDGQSWSVVDLPDGIFPSAIWPLSATQILAAGFGPSDVDQLDLWGSADGGKTWGQFSDPVFTNRPEGRDGTFFALGGTWGGQRIYAPGIGGTLWYGQVSGSLDDVANSLAPVRAGDVQAVELER